jgi:tRNA-dihydrouridine synthase
VLKNEDIFTVEDYNKLMKAFLEVNTVMLGRGILANPGLVNEIKNNTFVDKIVLKDFHDEIFNKYIELFSEHRNAILRMKELWRYMIYIFSDNKKYAKKIKKSQNLSDYNKAVLSLFTIKTSYLGKNKTAIFKGK